MDEPEPLPCIVRITFNDDGTRTETILQGKKPERLTAFQFRGFCELAWQQLQRKRAAGIVDSPEPEPDLGWPLTVAQVAMQLATSIGRVRGLIKRGEIKSHRRGGVFRVFQADLDAYRQGRE